MTLMPVSNIVVLDSSWSKAGALRWIGQRSVTSSFSPSSRLRHSPMALNTWPRVTLPTGTEIGAPVSTTAAPRTMPSVGLSEMARTMLSPRWEATSSVTVWVSPPMVTWVVRALFCSGIVSAENSTSTTGPMTRAMRPVAPLLVLLGASLTVAVMSLLGLPSSREFWLEWVGAEREVRRASRRRPTRRRRRRSR